MRNAAGYFLLMKQRFTKEAISVQDQLNLLSQKNLVIQNIEKAEHCLSVVGYYRLSMYFNAFLNENKRFDKNISFEKIWNIYAFDRKLRLLVSDAIEKIEVALRASLTNVLAIKYGAIWYTLETPFKKFWFEKTEKGSIPKDVFAKETFKILNRRNSPDFLRHYNKNFHPESPPSWMILECLPLGSCTSLYRNLAHFKDRNEIAEIFKQPPTVLDSWFDAIRYTRNICAHHSRLWNQWFVIEPKCPKSLKHIKMKSHSFHQQVIVLHLLNKALSPKSLWRNKLKDLFETYSNDIPFEQMGFATDWRNDEFWSLS